MRVRDSREATNRLPERAEASCAVGRYAPVDGLALVLSGSDDRRHGVLVDAVCLVDFDVNPAASSASRN